MAWETGTCFQAEDLSFCWSCHSCPFFRGGESSPEQGFAPKLEKRSLSQLWAGVPSVL